MREVMEQRKETGYKRRRTEDDSMQMRWIWAGVGYTGDKKIGKVSETGGNGTSQRHFILKRISYTGRKNET